MDQTVESAPALGVRPFSLTADPRFFFRSRSHGRAFDLVTFALRAGDPLLEVTGTFGTGKTLFCRTLASDLRQRALVSHLRTPLIDDERLMSVLLEDFGAGPVRGAAGPPAAQTMVALHSAYLECLARLQAAGQQAVVIVDEAHAMSRSFAEQLLSAAAVELNGERVVQVVIVGEPAGAMPGPGLRAVAPAITTRAQLGPLGRDECSRYVAHRLAVAGEAGDQSFSARALDLMFSVSSGIPRLINLLGAHALDEARAAGATVVEPVHMDQAVAALGLVRTRSRRFRWYTKRVS